MAEESEKRETPNPEDWAFEPGPIEGMPYERGSEEEKAIERVIEEAERRRRRGASAHQ